MASPGMEHRCSPATPGSCCLPCLRSSGSSAVAAPAGARESTPGYPLRLPHQACECQKSLPKMFCVPVVAVLQRQIPRRLPCNPCAPAPRAQTLSLTPHRRSAKSCWSRRSSLLPARFFRADYGVFHGRGNSNRERAAFTVRIIPALNLPTVRPYNSVTNTQTQPRALTGLLGGIERIENPLHVADSGSVVGQSNLDVFTFIFSGNPYLPSPSRFLDRVVGIV